MAGFDRDEVLAHTDLAALADELCGPSRGRGAGAKWSCPNPDHPDTHPSMGLYRGRTLRWKCYACGDGGTAIDLWMTVRGGTVGDAIAALARRAALAPQPAPFVGRAHRPTARILETSQPSPPARPAPPLEVDPAVERYAADAETILWTPDGEPGLAWLRARGLADDVLRANRVGYDPGPYTLRRPRGLPRRPFPGVVYPVLDPDGRAVYFQTRYLDDAAAGRKFANPTLRLAPNPHVAVLRVPHPDPTLANVVVVSEGIADGLVVVHTGAPVAAIVGAGNHGPDVAELLCAAFPTGRFIVPWDADHGGHHGGTILGLHLAERDRDVVLAPPSGFNDVGDAWRADPQRLPVTLVAAGEPAMYRPDDPDGVALASAVASITTPSLGG